MGPPRWHPCGPWPVQLRLASGLSGDAYVSEQGWRRATLAHCPKHQGRVRCGFARHGTYERKRPPGTQVARYYCPDAHQTFSLLPDCLAARLSGTLVEVEQVVVTVEQARSIEAAADQLRPDIELPGAVRWVQRRLRLVRAALAAVRGLLPETFEATAVAILPFRARLAVAHVLVTLREKAERYLAALSPPLGFGPRPRRIARPPPTSQHETGPDGSTARRYHRAPTPRTRRNHR